MGSTVKFTPFHPQDHEGEVYTRRNSHGAGIRITDMDGLEDDLSDSLIDQMDTRKHVDRSEYPGKEWESLLGFTTWGGTDDTADYHNISHTSEKDLAELFESISQYTEPFFVYLTGFEGSWPHVARLDVHDESFYYVEAADGEASLFEVTASTVDREEKEF